MKPRLSVHVVISLLLVLPLLIFSGIFAAGDFFEDDGQFFGFDEIGSGFMFSCLYLSSLATLILAKLKAQILISRQIILNFFYFGWHNCVYRRITPPVFFRKPGSLFDSRLFYFTNKCTGMAF